MSKRFERDTRLVAGSGATVRDHLKSIFQKVDIRSRRELLARFNAAADGP